ncbi:MAG: sigma 54-interacting transcriptional regulator [Pseudomonadales bacterium]|nr:sigma 54-interacting transcriptional regulator [Pseudomonadales bacterium]
MTITSNKDVKPTAKMTTGEQAAKNKQLQHLLTTHQLILNAAGEGIYGLDCDGNTTFVNAAAATILGWQAQDVLGKPLHDIHHHSHKDGSPYLREECPIYAALKDGEVHRVNDEVFWHADGNAIAVDYTSTPIYENDELKGAVVVFRDISERIKIEQERQQAFAEIKSLKEQLEEERDYLRDEINITANFGEIIGESQSLKRTLAQINAVANTPTSVLVLGESGVGKEMVARAIHHNSDRAEEPLVKVNCASIPQELFESEFFGHIKGAFTGAHRDRVGRMQLANGGTLFLDEVGEIPLDLQGKLLRALQENEFERVGDEETIQVDVRIVAATNRHLEDEVKHGRFREDLFYRLSVFPVEVPPLRERLADIAPLAQHFLNASCQLLGRQKMGLSLPQIKHLRSHAWPGNIRELKNVIERAVILSSGRQLKLEAALSNESNVAKSKLDTDRIVQDESNILTDEGFRMLEKANLIKAMRRCQWKISGQGGAAEFLGIKPSTLAYRLAAFGVEKK